MAVLGAPGTGKSQLLIARLDGVERAIILDPYDAIPAGNRFRSVTEATEFIKSHEGESYRVRVCPDTEEEINPCEPLARLALEEHAILVVDEAHEYLSHARLASKIEKGGAPAVLRLVRQGRHHEAALWVASQRPGAVARDLTGGERYIFRLEDARDLNFVRETLGPQAVPRVAHLKDHHALWVLRGQVREIKTVLGRDEKVTIVDADWPPAKKPPSNQLK
jgi:DNA helicase HerA-like ATPase